MEKKILFLDLDGTLLTDSKDITPENLAAIQKATKLGHAIVVCTGRPLVSTAKQLEKLGLTGPGCYAITSNGALIYDAYKKETIFYKGVQKDCIREAFDEAYKFRLHAQTYTDTAALCERETEEMKYYSVSTILPYEVVEDVTKALGSGPDPIKLLFIDLHDRSHLEAFRQHMEPWAKKNRLDMFFSCDQYLEFLPEGINKGSGVRFISEYLNVPYEHTLAAGDAENDISMLKAVKLPCVMKNARPEMYAYGAYLTEQDNNHSGIAEIIEKFML
ncbi:Cof-type HAD-IIB family hydrolase [Candidatus Merdisoma sp. JLR.KK011]|uniref:Cof-type HAD-IIB family hydrolase n=1 Tax=Candidatus Merdisoma sp. JLR.KK011 TaxID=3114299 RepID=UPI002FF3484F